MESICKRIRSIIHVHTTARYPASQPIAYVMVMAGSWHETFLNGKNNFSKRDQAPSRLIVDAHSVTKYL